MQREKKIEYDAIVVGSGASGGWACKRLAEAGLKVALLEAGKPQSDQNFSEHKPAFELKYRNRAAEMIRKTQPVQRARAIRTAGERSAPHARAPGTASG